MGVPARYRHCICNGSESSPLGDADFVTPMTNPVPHLVRHPCQDIHAHHDTPRHSFPWRPCRRSSLHAPCGFSLRWPAVSSLIHATSLVDMAAAFPWANLDSLSPCDGPAIRAGFRVSIPATTPRKHISQVVQGVRFQAVFTFTALATAALSWSLAFAGGLPFRYTGSGRSPHDPGARVTGSSTSK